MFGMIKTESKNFNIKQNDDYYYVIYLNNSILAYTASESDARNLVQGLIPLCKWKKYKDINQLFEKDPNTYAKAATILRRYAQKSRYNGNYLITLNDQGEVNYKHRNFRNRVTGINHSPGFAIRKIDNTHKLDSVYSGMTITEIPVQGDGVDETSFAFDVFQKIINKLSENFALNNPDGLDKLLSNQALRNYINTVTISILDGKANIPPPPKKDLIEYKIAMLNETNEEKKEMFVSAMNELYELVGINEIKMQVSRLIDTEIANRHYAKGKHKRAPMHTIYLGNAGTGKTEVARIYSKILWSLGIIKERKFYEVSKEDLVSKYIGETEEKTRRVIEDYAMGGVLFVDEAYTLNDGQSTDKNYGRIALETIMRAMENHRENIVIIFAGYKKEMERLLDSNQGLRSRFSYTFDFEDYDLNELTEIAKRILESEGYITDGILDNLKRVIKVKMRDGRLEGNARGVRNIVDQIINNHRISMSTGLSDGYMISEKNVMDLIDNSSKFEDKKEQKEQAINKLNSLIGLNNLKQEIQTWSNYLMVEKMRFDQGLSSNKPTLHMTFKGNPGTGKTTVARIIGDIFRYNGLVSRGHFTEVTRSDLVSENMGGTAKKVKEVVNLSVGGILFIDEAYSLVQGDSDTFGKEAVDTLISEMENNRDDLVVILAGYSEEIDGLLNANPGFKSRITNHFEFPDYNEDELYQLLELLMEQESLVLTEDAKVKVKEKITHAYANEEVDGNGRWVRNIIERIKFNQANRIVNEQSVDLTTIESSDI